MTTTPKKANSVQKPSKVPPVVSKGVRGRALTPAQKSDSSQGIRRFLAPTKSRESPALSLVSNDESAENAVPKLKKKGQVLGQTAEPPVARKAFSEMNSANETPVSRKKQTLTSVLHFQSTPEEAHADPKRQSSAMEPSPGSSTEKAKDTSDVNTRASRLRPVDSGYGENAEISKHTGHQNSGNGKSVIPLTEESPKHKGEEAATVTRTASRPSAEVIALKAQSNDESSVEASLGRLQGRGMNDERPPYKRSFSFANIATSPPKHPSGSRQHKRPRTTHWRGLDCVTRLTEQPTSRKGYQNLIINSNPEKETVDSNSLQECIHTVPKTPESASKPRLERSVSLPSFTSSPIRQGKRLPSKGKKGLHALNLELDSDNFKENIAPSWNLQPSTSVRSSHDHHAGMNTPGRRTRVTTRAVAASPSEIVNKTSEKRGAHLNLGSHKEKVATPASFAPEAPMIGERTLKLDKDNERVVNKKLPEDRFKFHRDDDDLLYSAALNAVLAGCDSQAPEQAHSEYVAIPQETIPVPAISQQVMRCMLSSLCVNP
ncbi:hypothetical protein DFJ77DRAFT_145679 [Powellomyces hirtus]|nr:hypothetical protein DFJ77DRAFT_145679 [Powellomyces hirtus]